MCGFAGVVAWDDHYRVSRETLGRMSAAIAHRGPDGEGYHINHEGEVTPDRPQVALAFRRLAILDPDPRSNQPFTDGRHWLVFNGEIYNFRELREELKALDPSYEWRTTGDTEVLVRAFDQWNAKCVERLNGMFAFAAWDAKNGEIVLARDRMGQKPLFYTSPAGGGAVAFASELSALQMLSWSRPPIDHRSVAEYLRWGYVPEPLTIYDGVRKLWPSTWLRIGRDGALGVHYFDRAEPEGLERHPRQAAQRTRALVVKAVDRQLVSDVPLGCFLSGGIDSSVIAAAMCSATADPNSVRTFSIGFEDRRYDESSFAARVAKHLGTTHLSFSVSPKASQDLLKLAMTFGEPFGDSSALPTHYLSRETRSYVKVALSGDGGDELFGGYDRYKAVRLAAPARLIPRALRRWMINRFDSGSSHPKSTSARARRFLSSLDREAADRYAAYVELFDVDLIKALGIATWKTTDGRNEPATPDFAFRSLETDFGPVPAALATDRITYLSGDLLTKVDRASMLHALEVRSPFMDPDVVTFAAGLTTDQLLKGGPKRMLREAFAADLPDFVFKRKKMGFAVPIGEWFRGELRPMLRDHLFASSSFAKQHFNMAVVERLVDEHEQSRVDHSQRLYALLMLELWWKIQRE